LSKLIWWAAFAFGHLLVLPCFDSLFFFAGTGTDNAPMQDDQHEGDKTLLFIAHAMYMSPCHVHVFMQAPQEMHIKMMRPLMWHLLFRGVNNDRRKGVML
jgi:hypothetical protein